MALELALNDGSGWKGRAQQIVMLKARVKQLEAQLRSHGQVSQTACRTAQQLGWCSVTLCALSAVVHSKHACYVQVSTLLSKRAIEHTLDYLSLGSKCSRKCPRILGELVEVAARNVGKTTLTAKRKRKSIS